MNQKGRSMVEMLGVLAIVGVLSIGAIAGYSKAMMKYKLNKQIQQISSLIAGVTQALRNEDFSAKNISGNLLDLKDIADKLGIIPKEMKKKSGSTFGIQDVLNNGLMLYWAPAGYLSPHFDGVFVLAINGYNLLPLDEPVCQNIYYLAKEMSASLYRISISVGVQRSSTRAIESYGDDFCLSGSDANPCIKDLTLSEIEELCTNAGEEKRWWINLLWF